MAQIHVVQPGDCLSSIGQAYGFAPATLWDHPDNAALRRKRTDPNVLQPGEDTVAIPDLRWKDVAGATGQRHRFIRRGVPEQLRIRLLRPNRQPRRQTPYRLTVDGQLTTGFTDDNGVLTAWIPPNARRGELIVDPDGRAEQHILQLGHLDPVESPQGVRQRLANLGYLKIGPSLDETSLAHALQAFQAHAHLPQSGQADEATRAALVAHHGC